MPLSWNEIKRRAIKFGNDWKHETREAAERQTFWIEFSDFQRIAIHDLEGDGVRHLSRLGALA